MEFILETYLGSVTQYLSQLEILSNELLSTESQISIGLDIAQHYLLVFGTFFSLVTLCCQGLTAFYGMFSMNMDPPEWAGSNEMHFVIVLTTTTAFIIGVICYFLYFSVREGFIFI